MPNAHCGGSSVLKGSPTSLAAAAAERANQNEAKATTHEAVDDEVDAGVDGEQQIAGSVDVQEARAWKRDVGGRVMIERDPGAQREVRQLADDEHDDDDDQRPSVLALLASGGSHAARAATPDLVRLAHRADQALVEERQRRERNEKSHDEEQTRLVDEKVYRVVAHGRLVHGDAPTVDDRSR